MMRQVVRGLNSYRGMGGTPIDLSEFSAETYQIAAPLFDSLLAPNDLLPTQWAEAFRQRLISGELALLAEVLSPAWEELGSPNRIVRLDAENFFDQPDAGQPLSLRFVCDVF